MTDERIVKVVTVRDRPVGLMRDNWGISLVAVERGYCPVSPTGYRSLSGLGEPAVTPDFLESLARDRERERREVLARARAVLRPERDQLMNFIHASGAAEKAFHDGFFAPDTERAELWAAAHRQMVVIDTDVRFQPAPTHVRWTEADCAQVLAKTRKLHRLLKACAGGVLPDAFPDPIPFLTHVPLGYFRLPPKPGGEPVVALPALTAEFELGGEARAARPKPSPPVRNLEQPAPLGDGLQLGLFGEAEARATRTRSPGSAGHGISP